MAVQVRSETVKQVSQHNEHNHDVREKSVASVPASWKLTPQQQAFIDVFADDEPKKQ
ncbi:hypothetical protein HV346_12365 [Enterobacter sp. RHBSTW-00994]|uniref:hypothetical protein n=1 Tax=Enterobacteriaceae TaxID=543 RepID=UPI0015EA19D7|nr:MULTISPECIES: hypothetical protein [Enterobacteriaceae]QLR43426.1 hypothetical protein HV346_12365 [Enterobacter sp. RHBSTW-00994]